MMNLRYNDKGIKSRDSLPVSVDMYHNYLPQSHCKVSSTNVTFKNVWKTCTLLHYTLLAKSERQCEMFLNDRYHNEITIIILCEIT